MITMAYTMMLLKDINLGKNGINNKNKYLKVYNEKTFCNFSCFYVKWLYSI